MRCLIAAFLLLSAIIYPETVERWIAPSPSWWYRSVDGGEVPIEKQRHDAEARATLELLERTPIVFRIASARYLSDLRKTNIPTSRIVFDHVEILKGRLSRASTDRKAFIIREE